MALDASAQLGLGCRRVVPEGLAEGQQLSFQGQLGGAPPLGLGMSAGFGLVVNPVDGVGPPGQWRSIGVEGAQVMDVPLSEPAPGLNRGGPSSAAWHHHSGEPTHTDGPQGSWSTESLMMSVAALVNVAALLWHAVPPSKSTFSTSPYLRLLQTPLRP